MIHTETRWRTINTKLDGITTLVANLIELKNKRNARRGSVGRRVKYDKDHPIGWELKRREAKVREEELRGPAWGWSISAIDYYYFCYGANEIIRGREGEGEQSQSEKRERERRDK
jgi:hypothetical protein